MPPAARKKDPHKCPDSTASRDHEGGAITSGCATVVIGKSLAARVCDIASCKGPADAISQGAATVIIGGMPAARLGDGSSHGGAIVAGEASVLLGSLSPVKSLDLSSVLPGTPRLRPDYVEMIKKGRAIVSEIVRFVRDPVAALSRYLKLAVGKGLDALGGLVFRGAWDKIKQYGKYAWKLLKKVPVLGDYITIAEAYANNLFDTLAMLILGQLLPYGYMPRGNIRCPGQVPSSKGRVLLDLYEQLPRGQDVTFGLRSLLQEVAPAAYWFSDDAPPISIGELLENGAWVDDETYFDFENGYARDPGRQGYRADSRRPYLTARKLSDRVIHVEVGFLRAVSFFNVARPNAPLRFEHEGDGERVYVYLQIDEVAPAGGRRLGTVRTFRVIGTGHGTSRTYPWSSLTFEGLRPRITVARGAHATSIVSGAIASSSWSFAMNSDCYPAPGDGNVTRSAAYVLPDEDRGHDPRLYRKPGKQQWWGKDRVRHHKVYPVWEYDNAPDENVPASALLPAGPDPAACPEGDACPVSGDLCQTFVTDKPATAAQALPPQPRPRDWLLS